MSLASDGFDRTLGRTSIVAFAAALLALSAPIWMGGVFLKDDLISYYLPTRFLYANALAEGHNFLWTSHLFNGFYLHGEGQVGMVHPVHYLLYRFLPLETAFNLEVLLPLPVLFAGTWILFTRRLKAPGASLAGALFLTCSSFNLLHLVHPSMMQVLAHVPWNLWLLDKLLQPSGKMAATRHAAVLALLLGSQLLLGHPVAFWISTVLMSLYVIGTWPAGFARKLPLLLAAGFFGLLLGAVQLLPTLETAQHSWRADPSFTAMYRNLDALVPANFLQWLNPLLFRNFGIGRPFPQETGIWQGTIPLLLALAAGPALLKRKPVFRLGITFAAAGILLSLGDSGFLFRLFQVLPFVGDFGTPNRFIFITQFGIAFLGAAALQDLHADTLSSWARKCCAWFTLAAAALSVTAILGYPASLRAAYSPAAMIVLGFVLTLAGTAGLVYATGRRISRPRILPGIFVAGMTAYAMYHLFSSPPWLSLEQVKAGTAVPPGTPTRVYSSSNPLLFSGYSLSAGYGGLTPAAPFEPTSQEALRLSGTAWVQCNQPYGPPGSPSLFPFGEETPLSFAVDGFGRTTIWQKVSNPVPRARLVEGLSSSTGSAQVTIDQPGHIAVEVLAEGSGQLVLTERWHPGWVCRVDGTPHVPQVLFGQYLGCTVTPGKQTVTFTFEPRSFRRGRTLSLGALAFVLLAMVWPSRKVTDPTETTP